MLLRRAIGRFAYETGRHLCRPSSEPLFRHGSTSRSRFSQMCWFALPPVELTEGSPAELIVNEHPPWRFPRVSRPCSHSRLPSAVF